MISRVSLRAFVAVFVLVSMLCQGTLVLAGTTGQLTGTATDAASNAPLAGAKVTIASPSQSATSTTDGGGHFSFLSLPPDTYTVSIELPGYQALSQSGVTVVADNARTLNLSVPKALRTIGRVHVAQRGELGSPGNYRRRVFRRPDPAGESQLRRWRRNAEQCVLRAFNRVGRVHRAGSVGIYRRSSDAKHPRRGLRSDRF